MSANTMPIFIKNTHMGIGVIDTANTLRDGTGTKTAIFAPAANGSRVWRIRVIATGVTTAGVVRIFIADEVSQPRLWKEILVDAITPSTTVEVFSEEILLDGEKALMLGVKNVIYASTHNAEIFNVYVEGGDY